MKRRLFLHAGLSLLSAGLTAGPARPALLKRSTTPKLEKVTSKDGTRIACHRTGSGPALVLVHGTTSNATRWALVLGTLAESFTVYAVDRRGRGESGDAKAYSLQREAEDVAAVVNAIGGPVYLLGHSFGGICCMEAMGMTSNVSKLILYEPPLTEGLAADAQTEKSDARIGELIRQGDRETALLVFSCEIVRKVPLTDEERLKARQAPDWPARVAAAHTLPRERKAVKEYRFVPGAFGKLTIPTLLLQGEKSPEGLVASTQMLKKALPSAQLTILPGQGHNAMTTAPDLFAGLVKSFLLT